MITYHIRSIKGNDFLCYNNLLTWNYFDPEVIYSRDKEELKQYLDNLGLSDDFYIWTRII